MKKELVNLSLGLSILAVLLSGYAISKNSSGGITAEEFDRLAESYPQRAQEKAERAKNEGAKNIAPITENDHVKGPRDAEITIYEYSDYECPYCKRFYQTPGEVVKQFNGKVNAVFRNFPLSFHDPLATLEANAAECAAEQGGDEVYFAYHDKIFEATKSNGNGLDSKKLYTFASELGLNSSDFKSCLDSRKYDSKVKNDIKTGSNAGITGTPGVIVKNNKTGEVRVLPGAVPLESVIAAVEELSK